MTVVDKSGYPNKLYVLVGLSVERLAGTMVDTLEVVPARTLHKYTRHIFGRWMYLILFLYF